MFEKFLEELGLSEKEARVYLMLLTVDSGAIHDIAEKTKINRTTVYPVLESLEKKGLVSEIQVGKKVEYQAAPPERLETYVERQKVMLDERSTRLKDVIPQIKSIQREQGERPIIKTFQGRDGAISAYTEFFNFSETKEREGYNILNDDLLVEIFTDEEKRTFRELRKGKNIKTVVIYNRSAGDRTFEGNKTAVRIDEHTYPINCDISVIDDNVIISTLGKKISAFLINSKDLATTLSSLIRYITDNK